MLSAEHLDTLMHRLRVAYQGKFPPKGIPMPEVRAAWGRELSGLSVAELKHGLAHLPPEWPPTAMHFRTLCVIPNTALPLPPPGPAKMVAAPEVTARLEVFAESRQKGLKASGSALADPKRWARKLRDREQRGEDLSKLQREMWRAALFELPNTQPEEIAK